MLFYYLLIDLQDFYLYIFFLFLMLSVHFSHECNICVPITFVKLTVCDSQIHSFCIVKYGAIIGLFSTVVHAIKFDWVCTMLVFVGLARAAAPRTCHHLTRMTTLHPPRMTSALHLCRASMRMKRRGSCLWHWSMFPSQELCCFAVCYITSVHYDKPCILFIYYLTTL